MAARQEDPENTPFGLGYIPIQPDVYALYSSAAPLEVANLPPKVDISDMMTPVKSQGTHGSCVGFAVCGVLDIFAKRKAGGGEESERFIWSNAKAADARDPNNHDPNRNNPDRGTSVDRALAVAQVLGSCWEETCSYDRPLDDPSPQAFAEGLKMKVTQWHRIAPHTVDNFRGTLFNRQPIIVGFSIFDNAQDLYAVSHTDGVMHMPREPVGQRTSGHAVILVGYNDERRLFKFKNSWGWTGENRTGYYYMPYDYLKYITEAWVVDDQAITARPGARNVSGDGAKASLLEDKDVEDSQLNPATPQQEAMRGFRITVGKQPCEVHTF
ncbi:hypothetical protein B0O80DRAFT_12886 [Mortierella sp. GBAus27b]|nr:hypothetical protein BGX31_009254 [Mortierella sp. GBA43]KAI8363410.1 hypothetical protein B0O80DRAFT_12886 [Mortierella sp. GBAus27b]